MKHFKAGALALALVVAVAGCGSSGNGVKKSTSSEDSTSIPAATAAPGSTVERIQKAGKFIVGVKFDQPGFGQKNPTTGSDDGFDIESTKDIAQGIFGGTKADAAKKIEYTESVSKNREPYIQQGKVDAVIATYTINGTRKQVVDFAGPYYIAHGDLMVKADNTTIKSIADVNTKKVCTVKGSTYEASIKAKAPQAQVTLLDNYSACAEGLTDGRYDAVATDNGILAGLVSKSNRAFKLANATYTDEPYGIGLKKSDDAFRMFINDRLNTIESNGQWKSAFEATIGSGPGALGLAVPTPPKPDAYASGTSVTTAAK